MLILSNRTLVENALRAAREGRLQAIESVLGANSYRDGETVCAIGASLPESILDHLVNDGYVESGVWDVDWDKYGVKIESMQFAHDLQWAHDWATRNDAKPEDETVIPPELMVWDTFESPVDALEAILRTLPPETAA